MPVLALAEAARHDFAVDQANLQRQVDHTHRHLKRGTKAYLAGKGQGGGVDTAGYALWTLEEGRHSPEDDDDELEEGKEDVIQPVVDWLLQKQRDEGFWKCSSHRPPSEASDFTSTYLAIRGLAQFSEPEQSQQVAKAKQRTGKWLAEAEAKDLEDHVFRLLTLDYLGGQDDACQAGVEQLKGWQRVDGGWCQKDGLESDAYATATAMYALARVGIDPDDKVWQRGVRFLLDSQQEDGSWHVVSRSKPFQKYFETGFPHGTDQFISTTASAWATIVLLESLSP
jgi:N-acyl-D-amino-acid deacylase